MSRTAGITTKTHQTRLSIIVPIHRKFVWYARNSNPIPAITNHIGQVIAAHKSPNPKDRKPIPEITEGTIRARETRAATDAVIAVPIISNIVTNSGLADTNDDTAFTESIIKSTKGTITGSNFVQITSFRFKNSSQRLDSFPSSVREISSDIPCIQFNSHKDIRYFCISLSVFLTVEVIPLNVKETSSHETDVAIQNSFKRSN